MSEPSESVTSPAATAAADPPEEPPGTHVVSQGLLVRWKAEDSVEEPKANSSILALPMGVAPAASMRWTQVAVKVDS